MHGNILVILRHDAVSRNTDKSTCKKATRLSYAGPRIGCGVTRLVIPRHDAVSRNTRVREYSLCVPFSSKRLPLSGPRIRCGVTQSVVHSSLQREERTKKRRRCYRALSFGGWHRPRGLRNSLRSDSPRPHTSVGWPPPGPIKAEKITSFSYLSLS